MRKSTFFVSAVLTTFAIVMLYSVVSTYRDAKSVAVAAVQPTATIESQPTDIPATPTQAAITPEEAAQIAAQVVGHTNLLSAESSSFNGVNAYLITFTNKDVVYVGLDGQILSVQLAPVVVNIAPPAKKNNNSGGGESESEGHDD